MAKVRGFAGVSASLAYAAACTTLIIKTIDKSIERGRKLELAIELPWDVT